MLDSNTRLKCYVKVRKISSIFIDSVVICIYFVLYLLAELRQREQDRERQKIEWEMKERQAEEQRRHEEELLRRHQDELNVRMHHQEDDLRRRQKENNLFIQVRTILSVTYFYFPFLIESTVRLK